MLQERLKNLIVKINDCFDQNDLVSVKYYANHFTILTRLCECNKNNNDQNLIKNLDIDHFDSDFYLGLETFPLICKKCYLLSLDEDDDFDEKNSFDVGIVRFYILMIYFINVGNARNQYVVCHVYELLVAKRCHVYAKNVLIINILKENVLIAKKMILKLVHII